MARRTRRSRIARLPALVALVAATACSSGSIDLGDHPSTLTALDILTGEVIWMADVPAYGRAGLDRPEIARVDATLVLATRDPVGMVAIGADSGLPVWQLATDWDRIDSWRVEDTHVAVIVTDDPRGTNESPRNPHTLRIDPVDGRVVSTDAYLGSPRSWPFDAMVLKRPTNTIIESIGQLDIWARCEPAVRAQPTRGLVCDVDSGPAIWLEATDATTGETAWELSVDHEFRSLASTNNTLFVAVASAGVSDLGDFASGFSPLVAVDASAGAELWRRSFPAGRICADIDGDVVYVIHTPPA